MKWLITFFGVSAIDYTYNVAGNAESVEFLLVVGAGLGAIVGNENNLLA
jgi:hypothetical protein